MSIRVRRKSPSHEGISSVIHSAAIVPPADLSPQAVQTPEHQERLREQMIVSKFSLLVLQS